MNARIDHAGLMDRVYRRQRHVYDATRKYYLVGRDPMIAGLNVPGGGAVLEIGCGTGRNLVQIAKSYPSSRLFGIDISSEMLATAGSSVARAGLAGQTRLALADAAQFEPIRSFGRSSFDRIVISYAVSMIPQWQAVVEKAVSLLAPGGELHIVDFGDMRELPAWTRSAMYTWLRWYHVTPRSDLFDLCDEVAGRLGCEAEARDFYRGFTWLAVVRRPDRLLTPAAMQPDAAGLAA